MVRLLRSYFVATLPTRRLFQSHNGAIAARVSTVRNLQRELVSIPQWCDCCRDGDGLRLHPFRRFNPTMVRLLQLPKYWTADEVRVSIPQWCDCCLLMSCASVGCPCCFNPTMVRLLRAKDRERERGEQDSFNPTMVRLLRVRNAIALGGYGIVSIPQWCDCCGVQVAGIRSGKASFNPTMVRLLRRRRFRH